jgi:hypothetical protein
MTIIAKPVIDKQFWILQENNQKIGNVEACDGGYQVKINNQIAQFKTIRMLQQRIDIEFESLPHAKKIHPASRSVHGYPTAGRSYNGIWSVPNKLPLYTKTAKSKSWYAAGWYQMKSGRNWDVIQDPKLILLQRYPYHGPFYTKEAAHEHSPAKVC